MKSTDQRKTKLCEKLKKFHFKLTRRPSSQNWSVEHFRRSATIPWILFNSSIIINLVYFIQYKFTFHMLKYSKLVFFSKDLPKMLPFYDTLLNGKRRQYYKNQRQMLSFFYTFHNHGWWTNSAVVLIKYDGDTNTWVYIQYTIVILPPGGPTYNLAISEGGNIWRKKFTNKLHDFSEIWT